MISVFLLFDRLVERRQKIVLTKARQSTAIVTSLFPQNVAERLMNEDVAQEHRGLGTKTRLKGFMNGQASGHHSDSIIADLFPHCTVFFADIAGEF